MELQISLSVCCKIVLMGRGTMRQRGKRSSDTTWTNLYPAECERHPQSRTSI